jgi:uncharacterized protein (TIGR00255 family)
MISSMTGFSARSLSLAHCSLSLEIRSVNQRYLEISFRLPDELRSLEPPLRELLGKHLSRGKVEFRASLAMLPGAAFDSGIDDCALETLMSMAQQARLAHPTLAPLSLGEVLRWPGILHTHQEDATTLRAAVLSAAAEAVDELCANRRREGKTLADYLSGRCNTMTQIIRQLREHLPALLQTQQSRLIERARNVLDELTPERLGQELALLVQRADVDEELSRLEAHLAETTRILRQGGVTGKRLDFLMQELNREANTLASKSLALETTQAAIELKVLIEQMREQVQNIE